MVYGWEYCMRILVCGWTNLFKPQTICYYMHYRYLIYKTRFQLLSIKNKITTDHLGCIVGFINGFISNKEIKVIYPFHETSLCLISHTGCFSDTNTCRQIRVSWTDFKGVGVCLFWLVSNMWLNWTDWKFPKICVIWMDILRVYSYMLILVWWK